MINNYPKFFTAAFCASGGANECNQANLLHTPVYSTIGTAEGDKKMKSFRETVESINKNGGEAKLDVLEGLNHSQACEKAFTAERLEWVFSH